MSSHRPDVLQSQLNAQSSADNTEMEHFLGNKASFGDKKEEGLV